MIAFYLEGDQKVSWRSTKQTIYGYTLYGVLACGLQASTITLLSTTLAPSRKHALVAAVSLAPPPDSLCSSLLTVRLLAVVPPAPPPPVAISPCRPTLVAPALAAVRNCRHLWGHAASKGSLEEEVMGEGAGARREQRLGR